MLMEGKGNAQGGRVDVGKRIFSHTSHQFGGGEIVLFTDMTATASLEKKVEKNILFQGWENFYRELLHEIKTPLGTIRNYLYIVTEEMKKNEGGRRKSDISLANLKAIHDETMRIDSLIKGMGSLEEVSDKDSNISELGEEILFMERIYNKILMAKGAEFHVHIPEGTFFVRVPQAEIKQIISNLIVNACDAVSEGGQISVSLSRDETRVWCDVEDSGGGVDEAITPYLFHTPLMSHKPSGDGLGLWITGRIVKRFEGTIEYVKKGNGSLFRVSFPENSGRGSE